MFHGGCGRTGRLARSTRLWWTWTLAFAPKWRRSKRKSFFWIILLIISSTTTGGPTATSSAKHWPCVMSWVSVTDYLLDSSLRLYACNPLVWPWLMKRTEITPLPWMLRGAASMIHVLWRIPTSQRGQNAFRYYHHYHKFMIHLGSINWLVPSSHSSQNWTILMIAKAESAGFNR